MSSYRKIVLPIRETAGCQEPNQIILVPGYIKYMELRKKELAEINSKVNSVAARIVTRAIAEELGNIHFENLTGVRPPDALKDNIQRVMRRSTKEQVTYRTPGMSAKKIKFVALNKALKVLLRANSLKIIHENVT
ncbi:unnamed protein product [Acanthoscelides obtectus]|uniref:Uncharacterized protein n=1 Tax=Acanthoscelides obtectus TaxID=200917 RepID=A0A9P0JK75_ACAOB|nr:unnamed protein product [Acanthoscelides obtectus]CAK1657953.1 hypothetical protein AOBTE_LOCUS20615 [Acanthoscelides obtectus]